jgi:hypothetical protein
MMLPLLVSTLQPALHFMFRIVCFFPRAHPEPFFGSSKNLKALVHQASSKNLLNDTDAIDALLRLVTFLLPALVPASSLLSDFLATRTGREVPVMFLKKKSSSHD